MARGDHIKVRRLRGLYTHHGIDMGDGTVIHVDGDPFRQIDVCVRRSTMEEFLAGGKKIVVDYPKNARDAEVVCEEALRRLGEPGYHLFKHNCEHFAYACKLGNGMSPQARRLKQVLLTSAASAALVASTAVSLGLYLRARKARAIS